MRKRLELCLLVCVTAVLLGVPQPWAVSEDDSTLGLQEVEESQQTPEETLGGELPASSLCSSGQADAENHLSTHIDGEGSVLSKDTAPTAAATPSRARQARARGERRLRRQGRPVLGAGLRRRALRGRQQE